MTKLYFSARSFGCPRGAIAVVLFSLAGLSGALAQTFTTVEPFESRYAQVRGISGGKVVGLYEDNFFESHGFVYDGALYTNFEHPNGRYTLPNGISGNTIVGGYFAFGAVTGQHGFIYDGSTFTTLIYPGAVSTEAHGVAGGIVVGSYRDDNEVTHGFSYNGSMFTPLDVPGASHTAVFGISGGIMVGHHVDSATDKGHGFIYDSSTFKTLDFPGARNTEARGVSGGIVVGTYLGADNSRNSFIYDGSTYTTLNVPAAMGNITKALDISGNTVAGYYSTMDDFGSEIPSLTHGFTVQVTGLGPAIYNLGTLPGGRSSQGSAINASGQVTGGIQQLSSDASQAFLYTGTPGAMVDLGTLGGFLSTLGLAINASGQIAGYSHAASGAFHAFLYTGTPGVDGLMIDIGLGTVPGASASYGLGINDSGQVVGHILRGPNNESSAFLYTGTPGNGGVMHNLGTLGGTESSAAAINASGQITGRAETSSDASHAFLYTGAPGNGGAMADLGTLPGMERSSGAAINNRGQVAGTATRGNDSRAFLYSGTPGVDGQMIDLGTLPGHRFSFARAINDRGQIAGSSSNEAFFIGFTHRAFLYTGTPGVDGQMIDLDAWLDANNPTAGANWKLWEAYGLTNNGLITGLGAYDDGPGGLSDGYRAFLLDASALLTPGPASAAFRITNVVLSGGNLTISFPTVTGRSYTLWRSDTLAAGTWTNTGLPALPGTGTILTFTVPAPVPSVSERFFRVQAIPQP